MKEQFAAQKLMEVQSILQRFDYTDTQTHTHTLSRCAERCFQLKPVAGDDG